MILVLAWLALAQEGPPPDEDALPPAEDAPATDAETPTEGAPLEEEEEAGTIVVYGEHLVEQARAKVAAELEEQGFSERIRKEDYTIYRHESAWKGEVRIYDDGWIRMRRQPVQFRPPPKSPVGWATCVIVPLCVRASGQSVGKRKHMAQRRRTLGQVEPLARQYGDRVADLHVDRNLVDLPDRLYALWEDGTPLEGTEKLPSVDARKQALLHFWESRTETVWGRRVRAAVEAFIREEVQYGPFPFTTGEIAAFNAKRQSTAELDLERPWDQVTADLEERAGR